MLFDPFAIFQYQVSTQARFPFPVYPLTCCKGMQKYESVLTFQIRIVKILYLFLMAPLLEELQGEVA